MRRTIRVVLYANEEFGLSGAKQYAKAHADSVQQHVAGLEADFDAGRVWKFSSQVDGHSLDIVDELHELLAANIERGLGRLPLDNNQRSCAAEFD